MKNIKWSGKWRGFRRWSKLVSGIISRYGLLACINGVNIQDLNDHIIRDKNQNS